MTANLIDIGEGEPRQQEEAHSSHWDLRRRPYCLTTVFAVLALFALLPAAQISKNRPISGHTVVRSHARDLHSSKGAREVGPLQILQRQLQTTPAHDANARQSLHFSLGRLLHEKGYYIAALEQYEKAESLAKRESERLKIIQHRAQAEFSRGRVSLSKSLLESAIKTLGADEHSALPGLLHALGDAQVELGAISQGLETYSAALRAAVDRDDSQEQVLLLADQGEALTRLGRSTEALEKLTLARRKIEALEKTLQGVSPLVVAKVDSYFGEVLQGQGAAVKAKRYYFKALAVQERELAPSHPDLISTRISLARLWHDFGDTSKSLKALEEVERTLLDGPNEGPSRSRVLLLFSDFSRLLGELPTALGRAEEGLKLQKAIFDSPDHPELAIANANLGSVLHDLGRYTEARRHYQDALNLQLKVLGGEHPEVAATHNSLGTLYQDLQMVAEAVEHFSKCLEIQRKTVSESSPDVANTYNNLATVLFQQGHVAEAKELLTKAIGILDALGVAASSPERILYEENLQEVEASVRSKAGSKASIEEFLM